MARAGWPYLLLLLSLLSFCMAATPPSFCKCTCFTNSTIIPLAQSSRPPPPNRTEWNNLGSKPLTCADCNKQFCLSYDLPICENATDEDVFTTCFQRDSIKDQTVIFIFIFATVGLLVWAAVKPYVARWMDDRRARGLYTPVETEGRL